MRRAEAGGESRVLSTSRASIAAAWIGLLAIGGSLACGGSDRIEKVVVEEEPPATGVEQPGILTIRGRVVDAESEAGIGEALVVIYRPGVTARQLRDTPPEATTALLQAIQFTGEDGDYEISGILPRGNDHTVMVSADRYHTRVFDEGLEIEATDPAVVHLESIALEPE